MQNQVQTAFAKIYSKVTTKVSKIILSQTASHFPLRIKPKQRIIEMISIFSFLGHRYIFVDIDSHKKLDFVLIPISMS